MKNKYPKISILTPSYNSGKYIERAIQSVLQQDYDNWEHIIVDGGSTDETPEILKKYPHLKWISEPDKGQSDAMNKAFEMSSGDIIGYLNADDEYSREVFPFVASQFLKKNIDFLVGNLYQVFPDQPQRLNKPATDLYSILNYWPCRFPLNALSYFYKRIVQENIGPFPVDNHFTMDYWFLLRAYKQCSIYYSDRIFGTFYFDADNKSADAERARRSLRKVRNQFLANYPGLVIFYFGRKIKSYCGYQLFLFRKMVFSKLN